ncbi:MAG: TetR family transcriptional regulator [Clostridia bacterium]|nr:TetR family transcriptional regulator [Clostridia bacterium]
MEEQFVEQSVRTRLILAGITELEEHGLTDFSLRRAALAAQVSCAAPYRHFKDKEAYIDEIIKYVGSKWELLTREIEKIFGTDPLRLAKEICISSIRFRIANRNFRSVFTLAAKGGKSGALDSAVDRAVGIYSEYRGLDDKAAEIKLFSAKALINGALMMAGDDNGERILELAYAKLSEEFK